MSTNFYIRSKPRKHDGEHICQTAAGWEPMLHAHKGLESLEHLKELCLDGYEIYDEYGETYSFNEFNNRLRESREYASQLQQSRAEHGDWVDKDGNIWARHDFS